MKNEEYIIKIKKKFQKYNRKLIFLLFIFYISNCSFKEQKTIDILGSDTMLQLGQKLATSYIKNYPKENISIQGGGSGRGIAALINGLSDIASSSRKIKQKEIEIAKKKHTEIIEKIVGYDGIAIIVNKQNPIQNLTIQQISDIYTNKINNWKELGWNNQKIVAIARENNSGTYEYFKTAVVRMGNKKSKKSYGKSILYAIASQQIIQQITRNPKTIGFLGMGWVSPTVKVIAVKKHQDNEFHLPNIENITKGKYPIFRELYMYTTRKKWNKSINFLQYVLSNKGQNVIKQLGFVTVY